MVPNVELLSPQTYLIGPVFVLCWEGANFCRSISDPPPLFFLKRRFKTYISEIQAAYMMNEQWG